MLHDIDGVVALVRVGSVAYRRDLLAGFLPVDGCVREGGDLTDEERRLAERLHHARAQDVNPRTGARPRDT